MKFEKIIDGLTDRIEFMIDLGAAPLVDEAARRELLSQQQEVKELELTIIRMKHTLEVIASNPGWNDHHCRAMKILEEYSEHNKAKGK